MSTALEKANELLASLQAFAIADNSPLPTPAYAQLGEAVVTCASTIVTLTSIDPVGAEYQPDCTPGQIGNFAITIARDCGVVYDETSGVDDPDLVVAASEDMDADGDLLWRWAATLDLFYVKTWTVSFSLPGGLLISAMALTLGID